jgi:hypothetical protein
LQGTPSSTSLASVQLVAGETVIVPASDEALTAPNDGSGGSGGGCGTVGKHRSPETFLLLLLQKGGGGFMTRSS